MQLKVEPTRQKDCSDVEWQARVDLAAAHRLAYMHGFSEGIFNHLTLVVPGRTDRYYQIPFGTHWSEVSASTFMEVGFDGAEKRGAGDVGAGCCAKAVPAIVEQADDAADVSDGFRHERSPSGPIRPP